VTDAAAVKGPLWVEIGRSDLDGVMEAVDDINKNSARDR
jgi:hypothetical protein